MWNKVPTKEARIWSPQPSKSSNIRLLRYLQMLYIKHNGTKFQISDECFPHQFLHPTNRSVTLFGKTQETPNDVRTKLQQWWAYSQWIRRWSTVSPLHQHMQHQSTIEKPLPLKLSPVIIFPHTADHTKKETQPHVHIGNSWNDFKNLLQKEWV